MTIRRIALTVLGFSGSILAALTLCISAQSILAQPTETGLSTIEFPYVIPDTTLVVQALTGYDGPFLEDGTDREMVNVVALIIRNSGATIIESAQISLHWGDGMYTFAGSYIPAGGTAVLIEQNGQIWKDTVFTHCTGNQTTLQAGLLQQEIMVTEEAMGTVILTNTTEDTIYGITIYHKTWLSPQDMYIGGITYAMDVPHLLPGQTAYLYPDHYAVGYSRVVCIQGFSNSKGGG